MLLFTNRVARRARTLNQPVKGIRVRSLFSFCAFHFVDDSFTDFIYLFLPFIAAEFNLSFSRVGLLRGVFSGAMSLFQVPLTLLAERIGEARVVGVGILGLAGGSLLLGRTYGNETRKETKNDSSFISFVPGNRIDRIEKAFASPADGVIIDLEDAVAPSEKESVREGK